MVFNDSTNLNNISRYIVDTNGNTPYLTLQSAMDAANAAGGNATVFVRDGIYTEDTTLYDSVFIEGQSKNGTTIFGTHTPPNAGVISFNNITLKDESAAISSAAAGTAEINITDCIFDIDNGTALDIRSWVGDINVSNIKSIGVTDGGIGNDDGVAKIEVTNSDIGVGAVQAMLVSGDVTINNCNIRCQLIARLAASVVIFGGCKFDNNVSNQNTSSTTITNSLIASGASIALTQSSANPLTLTNVSIDTSNAVAISGAGAGVVNIGSVDFVDSSAIAGTLTINRIQISDQFPDNTFRIFDNTDTTKVIAIEAGAITAGTTRTITAADRDLNLDTPVFTSVDATAYKIATLDAFRKGAVTTLLVGTGIAATPTSTSTTVVGIASGASLTTGSYNTLIGNKSGDALTTGAGNVGIGPDTISSIVNANDNIAIGSGANENGTGSSNTIIGANAVRGAGFVGNNNTVVGNDAGSALTSAASNCLLGSGAGDALTTGAGNVILGTGAAPVYLTGSNSVIIGTNAASAETAGNKLHIGNSTTSLIEGDFIAKTLTLDAATSIGTSLFATDTAGALAVTNIDSIDQTTTNTINKLGINDQTGVSYTITASDMNKRVKVANAAAITVTLPQASTEALVDGFQCTIVQGGVGQITIAVEGADNLNSADSLVKLRTTWSSVTILRESSGNWYVSGDMSA